MNKEGYQVKYMSFVGVDALNNFLQDFSYDPITKTYTNLVDSSSYAMRIEEITNFPYVDSFGKGTIMFIVRILVRIKSVLLE